MNFNVISPDFRKQLEQQRSRLLKERDGIIKAAVAQASEAVDANIGHINALLGGVSSAVVTTMVELPTKRAYTRRQPQMKAPVKAAMNAPRYSKIMEHAIAPEAKVLKTKVLKTKILKTKVLKTKILKTKVLKTKVESAGTNAKKIDIIKVIKADTDFPSLQSAYATLTPAQAIVQVLKTAPKQVFDVDKMISTIYGAIDEQRMTRTRQRIGVMLGHSARRQECVRVQGETAQYRWNG